MKSRRQASEAVKKSTLRPQTVFVETPSRYHKNPRSPCRQGVSADRRRPGDRGQGKVWGSGWASLRTDPRQARFFHSLSVCLLALVLVAGLSQLGTAATAPTARSASAPAPAPAPGGLLRFTRLNHAYSEPATAVDPITEGPLTVRLSSPSNKLVLVSNALRLEPGADGLYTADLEVRFYGKGRVVADVDMAGVGGLAKRFTDEVVVLPQTRRLEGRVRVARSGDGYLLVPERLPRDLPVRIQSQLGNDIVGLCERIASLPFSDLDCSGLDRALSTARVPLPHAGEGFYLARTDLTPDERRQIETYLVRTRVGGTRR